MSDRALANQKLVAGDDLNLKGVISATDSNSLVGTAIALTLEHFDGVNIDSLSTQAGTVIKTNETPTEIRWIAKLDDSATAAIDMDSRVRLHTRLTLPNGDVVTPAGNGMVSFTLLKNPQLAV